MQDLSSPGADSVNLGNQVLGKYGLGDRGTADSGVAAGLLAPVGIVLSPAVGALFMSISTVIVAINAQLLRRTKLATVG